METGEIVHKLVKMSRDDRFTKEEQDLLLAAAVRLEVFWQNCSEMELR